jgi:hypothetical protein
MSRTRGGLGGAGALERVDEAFAAGGSFGGLRGGKAARKRPARRSGVHHDVLRPAGVDRHAVDLKHGGIGAEGLAINLAGSIRAVEGVGRSRRPRCARSSLRHAAGDFLVGIEADADFAVGDFRVPKQVTHGGHDGGDAGLVVGAEQGGAAGGDDVVADGSRAGMGLVSTVSDLRGVVGQHDGLAVVGAVDDGLGRAGEVGRGVHVGEPGEGGGGLAALVAGRVAST